MPLHFDLSDDLEGPTGYQNPFPNASEIARDVPRLEIKSHSSDSQTSSTPRPAHPKSTDLWPVHYRIREHPAPRATTNPRTNPPNSDPPDETRRGIAYSKIGSQSCI